MGHVRSRAVEVNREQGVSFLPCSSATTVIINKIIRNMLSENKWPHVACIHVI